MSWDSKVPENSTSTSCEPTQGPGKLTELSTEEVLLLKKLRHEAFMYRGLPLGLVAMSLTSMGISRKFPHTSTVKRLAFTIGSGIMGNLVGQISYVPHIRSRLESDLPQDSKLRQIVISAKQGGSPFQPGHNHGYQRNSDQSTMYQGSSDQSTMYQGSSDQGTTGMYQGNNDQSTIGMYQGNNDQSTIGTYQGNIDNDTRGGNNEYSTFDRESNEDSYKTSTTDEYNRNTKLPNYTSYDELRRKHRATETGKSPVIEEQNIRYNKYGDRILD